TAADGDGRRSNMTRRRIRSGLAIRPTRRRRNTTRSADWRATRSWRIATTFSPSMGTGELPVVSSALLTTVVHFGASDPRGAEHAQLPTYVAPRGAQECSTFARRGHSHSGGVADRGAAEDQPSGRQISGYTERRPALGRDRRPSTSQRMQIRSRRDQPERLVPVVCPEGEVLTALCISLKCRPLFVVDRR